MKLRRCFYEATLAGGVLSSIAATWLLTADLEITAMFALLIATLSYVGMPLTIREKNEHAFLRLYRHRDVLGDRLNYRWSFCRATVWPVTTMFLWSYTAGVTVYVFSAGVVLAWGVAFATAAGWFVLVIAILGSRTQSGSTGVNWDNYSIQTQGEYWDQVKQELYQREAIEQLQRDRNRRHGR